MDFIQRKEVDGISVIAISGRLDASTSADVHREITGQIDKGATKLIVDFLEVSYISSAGLRTLIYASKTLKQIGGKFAICSINSNVKKILDISGLTKLFLIYENAEASALGLK